MSKNHLDAATLDIPIQRAIFGQKVCPFRVFEDREPPAQAFLEVGGALTDWTPRAAPAVLDHSRPLPRGGGGGPQKRCPGCDVNVFFSSPGPGGPRAATTKTPPRGDRGGALVLGTRREGPPFRATTLS